MDLQEVMLKLSGWGTVQVAPYGPPPPLSDSIDLFFCISGGFTDGTGGLQTPQEERKLRTTVVTLTCMMTSQTWDTYGSVVGSTSWWAEFLPAVKCDELQKKISMVHHGNLCGCHPIRMRHIR